MPTSITVAPGFMKSRVIIPGLPIAATRISASRQTPARSRVFEWQTVTVAFSCNNIRAMGLPTMSLRPTTTARWPAIGICRSASESRWCPAGVQLFGPGRPVARFPTLQGWKPSTSFSGATESKTFCESMWPGSGSCTRMPSISCLRPFNSWTSAISSSVEMLAGGVMVSL